MSRAAIVVATYNRPQHLRDCLAALAQLEGGPYRVVVVDDGSPQSMAPICAAAGPHVTMIRQVNAGPAAARNRGVREAGDAEIILFTDDDCRPSPDWAAKLIVAHGGKDDRLVGGCVVNGLERNAFSGASQAILTYSYGQFADFSERLSFFTTNNLCVARARFLDLGGFDERYGFASEDRDFSFRWKRAGGHLVYQPQAIVSHLHRLGFSGFLRQHYAYGRGARRFHERVAQSGDAGVKLGRAGFYAGLLLHPLKRPSPHAALRTGLIGIAHAALAAGYLREMRASNRAQPQDINNR